VPAAMRPARVDTSRECALRVLRRVFEQGAYADRALHAEGAGLEPRERALAMALAYGTIQRRATLDHVAARLLTRRLEQLEPVVLAALRMGLFQLLYLEGVADHAAVNETVDLVKQASRRGAGLVNAVLRRAAAQGGALLADLDDCSPETAAIKHSVPGWLAARWWDELGADTARELLRRINQPAESALRINTLVAPLEEAVAALPVPTHPAPGVPDGVVLEARWDVHGSELWRAGAIMPQSRASMLVAHVLEPSPGERILDLCAAPGGKTTHLAALMGDRGKVVAVERHEGRAKALAATCARMHAGCVDVHVADAALPREEASFDHVLVDPPCSGLGTMQARPDLRWRVTPDSVTELVALQSRILAAGAAATRPGGALVYSVCTISQAESERVIERFLGEHRDFVAEDLSSGPQAFSAARSGNHLQLLPHRDGTDGFFIARLRRAGRARRPGPSLPPDYPTVSKP
jgi:16S rRNA (cytosine967-C5)-methyltransferase